MYSMPGSIGGPGAVVKNQKMKLFVAMGSSKKGRVPTAQGKQGKWPKKIPVRENTGYLEILSKHREFCQNTGNFVSSSCKCSDSKSKGYCDSCPKKIHFFPEAG